MNRSPISRSSDEVRKMLDRHICLDRNKSISYLPIKTIENVLKINVLTYRSMIENAGHRSIVWGPENCCIESGAVYAFSYKDLEAILGESQKLLLRHHWPTNPIDFIKKIASEWIKDDSPLLPLIGKAFGES